jgi:hypothetical protein
VHRIDGTAKQMYIVLCQVYKDNTHHKQITNTLWVGSQFSPDPEHARGMVCAQVSVQANDRQ